MGPSNNESNSVDSIVLLFVSLCLYPWTTKNDKIDGHSIVFYTLLLLWLVSRCQTYYKLKNQREQKTHSWCNDKRGDATPLNPNKHFAILGKSRVPIDISGTKIWVHDPNKCFWISNIILENGFWEPYVQSALMNSVGVKRKDDNSPSLFVDFGANIGIGYC